MSGELDLLEAARGGDQDAFAQLVGPHQAQLRAHCYRMLGSLPDADDALQETLLRAWRGLDRFEGRSSLRSWLYTIATNASLRTIEKRPKRLLPVDYAPAADPHDLPAGALTESVWLEPYPDGELGVEGDMLGPDARYEQRESIVKRFQLRPISANGQPAAAAYIWDEQTGTPEAESIIVLTLRDDGIEEITAFRTPELFPLFGLPEQPPTAPPGVPAPK